MPMMKMDVIEVPNTQSKIKEWDINFQEKPW